MGDVNEVKNKRKRAEVLRKLKRKRDAEKKQEKTKRQRELKEKGLPLPEPQTIESMRTMDCTFVSADDPDLRLDQSQDEFEDLLSRDEAPSVLITTCPKPSKTTHLFVKELENVLPYSIYKRRKETTLITQVMDYANEAGHTAVVVVNEDSKEVNGLTVIHLPAGPTACFKLSNLRLSREIVGHGKALKTSPELILNNFKTRLGHRISRSLQSLFHQFPKCHNRQVATFHNQRDFLFFRHHRYIFEKKQLEAKKTTEEGAEKKTKQTKVQARLQELGPRFTLRLLSLQKGILNWKHGEFEWVNSKQGAYNRRTFVL